MVLPSEPYKTTIFTLAKWHPMTELNVNPTDETVLDFLKKGRCTPSYIAQETNYSRGNVQNRLVRLAEHGYVKQLGGGLYELIEDPRNHDKP
jgi:predicted Rossmann fold nucleotide-binding protein DprA/Smf involved in DNA uptake